MRLIIPSTIEARLHAYVRSVSTEIAGMGKAQITEDGDITLTDIAIYDQEVTGGTADLSSAALAKFQTELIQKGESPKEWIVWWHSHANMEAFFSGRDTSTIDDSDEFQYLVSLVVNKKRERKARFDLYKPVRLINDNLEIIVRTEEEIVPQEIRDEVAEKVHIKTYPWPQGTGFGFGSHEGKVSPARNADDYGGYPSGTKRLVTAGGSIYLDRDDILACIDAVKHYMKDHEKAGTTESYEYLDLKEDLVQFQLELVGMDKRFPIIGSEE